MFIDVYCAPRAARTGDAVVPRTKPEARFRVNKKCSKNNSLEVE